MEQQNINPHTMPYTVPLVVTKLEPREYIYDVAGSLWQVHAVRPTKHGFNLCLGSSAEPPLGAGRPCFIMTPELVQYLRTHRTGQDGVWDLPASRNAIANLRGRLGLSFAEDRLALWKSRLPDLKKLSLRQFATCYNLPYPLVQLWRRRLLGPSPRKPDWWQSAEVQQILQSGERIKLIARKLRISDTHASRLREKSRQMSLLQP